MMMSSSELDWGFVSSFVDGKSTSNTVPCLRRGSVESTPTESIRWLIVGVCDFRLSVDPVDG
jgi:hypothetical protein